MALKTFNINKEVYDKFSKHCKAKGISMSKQVENFISAEIEKIAGIQGKDVGESIDNKKIEKNFKEFDHSLEHPLKKYC